MQSKNNGMNMAERNDQEESVNAADYIMTRCLVDKGGMLQKKGVII